MPLQLTVLPEEFSVCRFPSNEAIPEWATTSKLFCVMRTAEELSMVCPTDTVPSELPSGSKVTTGWRAFKLHGPFAFEVTGILASVLSPLAEAGVSIFALSTYDTDYVLVRENQLDKAVSALHAAGHSVHR